MVETRMAVLDANWEKFEANHNVLQATHWKALSDKKYFKDNLYAVAEETCFIQKAMFLDLLDKFQRTPTEKSEERAVKSTEGAMRKTLPRIQLPQISGGYEDWPAFRDLFQSMVTSDPSLHEVERLHYFTTLKAT
ncbi:uncharacterized protein LOC112467231 [Temnothorax curvispinosus]|uniref:Uncharacterized protein LOC112467231 n=1 Tax=Temnothorax curvispinosus TaxID=300111 RepID=A0A6J1RB94_9HYME|nr:uncharacterized protein LOC112467231 [Temnothorax curvispinosus]